MVYSKIYDVVVVQIVVRVHCNLTVNSGAGYRSPEVIMPKLAILAPRQDLTRPTIGLNDAQ
jgi:hypothetical protein